MAHDMAEVVHWHAQALRYARRRHWQPAEAQDIAQEMVLERLEHPRRPCALRVRYFHAVRRLWPLAQLRAIRDYGGRRRPEPSYVVAYAVLVDAPLLFARIPLRDQPCMRLWLLGETVCRTGETATGLARRQQRVLTILADTVAHEETLCP